MTGKYINRLFTPGGSVILLGLLFVVNMLLRLLVYYNTELFYFADYQDYLEGIDRLEGGEKLFFLSGNFVMTISYLGYFVKQVLGSLDWFFVFNCLMGSVSSLLMAMLAAKLSGSVKAAIVTMLLLTLYTEFMVFSSVFYTPVIMIFVLSLFLWAIYYYYTLPSAKSWLFLLPANIIFILSLLFKPELVFLPLFLVLLSILLRKEREMVLKSLSLAFTIFLFTILFYSSQIITRPAGYVASNSFIFYGHTDYGGDGGEGSFVYQENYDRYMANFNDWCDKRNITEPRREDFNKFQEEEIKRFITGQPLKWAGLQLKKFTRTFGVVPEGSSFKVLYTGLTGGRLWMTSIMVALPVAILIILFIQVFSLHIIRSLAGQERGDPHTPTAPLSGFMKVYLMLLIYYIIAICFFGHYQERYRMPVMVCFIVPMTAVFISGFNPVQYLKRPWIYVRTIVTIAIFTIWIFQSDAAMKKDKRLQKSLMEAENDAKRSRM